jgi:hypothetical protein
MIDVKNRHLNQRYYGGMVSAMGEYRWNWTMSPKNAEKHPAMKQWLELVKEALASFQSIIPCEGSVEFIVNKGGFSTEGLIYVFDEPSMERIPECLTQLYDAITRGKDICIGDAMLRVKCEFRMTSVYLANEDATVPFKELDTEPIGKYPSPKDRVLLATAQKN